MPEKYNNIACIATHRAKVGAKAIASTRIATLLLASLLLIGAGSVAQAEHKGAHITKVRGSSLALLDPATGKTSIEVPAANVPEKMPILADEGGGRYRVEYEDREYLVKSYQVVTDKPITISSKCQAVKNTGHAATRGAGECK